MSQYEIEARDMRIAELEEKAEKRRLSLVDMIAINNECNSKIAELEPKLKEAHVGTLTFTPQEYRKVKADAIRDMLEQLVLVPPDGGGVMELSVDAICKYADNLEKSDV